MTVESEKSFFLLVVNLLGISSLFKVVFFSSVFYSTFLCCDSVSTLPTQYEVVELNFCLKSLNFHAVLSNGCNFFQVSSDSKVCFTNSCFISPEP